MSFTHWYNKPLQTVTFPTPRKKMQIRRMFVSINLLILNICFLSFLICCPTSNLLGINSSVTIRHRYVISGCDVVCGRWRARNVSETGQGQPCQGTGEARGRIRTGARAGVQIWRFGSGLGLESGIRVTVRIKIRVIAKSQDASMGEVPRLSWEGQSNPYSNPYWTEQPLLQP